MKVIETKHVEFRYSSADVDFILLDEKKVEFIDGIAVVNLIALTRREKPVFKSSHIQIDYKIRGLVINQTSDYELADYLSTKYWSVVAQNLFTIIDEDFKECDFLELKSVDLLPKIMTSALLVPRHYQPKRFIKRLSDKDFIVEEDWKISHVKIENKSIVGTELLDCEWQETSSPSVLKNNSNKQLYNLNTMKYSRHYSYIGDFRQYVDDKGNQYYACYAQKIVIGRGERDNVDNTLSSTLNFFIDEEGKIISPVIASHNDMVFYNGENDFDEIVKTVEKSLKDYINKPSTEEFYQKKLSMKKRISNE